jgi:hypothetical protein
MGSRRPVWVTPKDTERLSALQRTLDTLLTEARALRRRLELLAEARQISMADLRPAGRSARYLNLRHANRVF